MRTEDVKQKKPNKSWTNDEYETYEFMFTYIVRDMDDNISLQKYTWKTNNVDEKTLPTNRQNRDEMYKFIAKQKFYEHTLDKIVLDYKLDYLFSMSSKRLNSCARAITSFREDDNWAYAKNFNLPHLVS